MSCIHLIKYFGRMNSFSVISQPTTDKSWSYDIILCRSNKRCYIWI